MRTVKKLREKLKKQTGASILMAMVVMLAVTMACAAMMEAVSANVKNTGQESERELARILATSMDGVIRDQFSDIIDSSTADQGNNIANYVYKNLAHRWLYYDESDVLSSLEGSTKKIELTSDEIDGTSRKIVVSMYWESSAELELAIKQVERDPSAPAPENYNDRILHITVIGTVAGKLGSQSCAVTTDYEYTADKLWKPQAARR